MLSLENEIAVVTGGSSGIGLATARRFVEQGACVFIAGRRQVEIDKTVAETGRNVTAVKADISRLDDLDRLYETVARKGEIDRLTNGVRKSRAHLSHAPARDGSDPGAALISSGLRAIAVKVT